MCSHSMAQLTFYLFGENMIFRKRLGVAMYFCFIFFLRENKIRKKTLSVTPYLEKRVYEKPKSSSRVKLLIKKVRQKIEAPF